MEKISSILVPFDFSESSERALDYAVNFVGNRLVYIDLVHVPKNENDNSLVTKFEAYKNKYKSKLRQPLRWTLGSGKLIEAIIEVRGNNDKEIVIMGTSGLDEDEEFTHTSQLVAVVKCPVIVVPKDTEKSEIKNICLVLGKNEIDNPKALHVLLEICRTFEANVHVLTVQNTEELIGYSKADEKNENTLKYYLEEFYADHTFIEHEDILEGIFNYTNTHEIDLIAIIPGHHTKNSAPSKGRLTRELVFKSDIPVLTIE